NDPVLDRFRKTSTKMLAWQCFKNAHIDDDGRRLMERADEILAKRSVDSGLSPDGRVDHRKKAGRHLHVRHTTHERRGNESRQLTNNAAAERDDGRVAPEARLEQLVRE